MLMYHEETNVPRWLPIVSEACQQNAKVREEALGVAKAAAKKALEVKNGLQRNTERLATLEEQVTELTVEDGPVKKMLKLQQESKNRIQKLESQLAAATPRDRGTFVAGGSGGDAWVPRRLVWAGWSADNTDTQNFLKPTGLAVVQEKLEELLLSRDKGKGRKELEDRPTGRTLYKVQGHLTKDALDAMATRWVKKMDQARYEVNGKELWCRTQASPEKRKRYASFMRAVEALWSRHQQVMDGKLTVSNRMLKVYEVDTNEVVFEYKGASAVSAEEQLKAMGVDANKMEEEAGWHHDW